MQYFISIMPCRVQAYIDNEILLSIQMEPLQELIPHQVIQQTMMLFS